MKKLLFITCIFLLPVYCLAQKATEKDLQGMWKLSAYGVPGALLNVNTGQVTLSTPPEDATAVMMQRLKTDMESYAEGLKTAYIEIKDDTIYQLIIDVVKNGTFTLGEKDGKQVINAIFDDGTEEQIPFKLANGKLNTASFNNSKQYIYVKQ